MVQNENYTPPPGYPELSSRYGPLWFDGSCSKPIAWGFTILSQMTETRFQSLGAHGKLICLEMGKWALAVKWLTPESAIEEYGPITHQQFGPQGGWRSVTYGTTKFTAQELKPSPELASRFNYEKEVLPRAGADKSSIFQGLYNLRNANRYSQATFANILDIPKETVVRWEKNLTKRN